MAAFCIDTQPETVAAAISWCQLSWYCLKMTNLVTRETIGYCNIAPSVNTNLMLRPLYLTWNPHEFSADVFLCHSCFVCPMITCRWWHQTELVSRWGITRGRTGKHAWGLTQDACHFTKKYILYMSPDQNDWNFFWVFTKTCWQVVFCSDDGLVLIKQQAITWNDDQNQTSVRSWQTTMS